MRIYRLDRTIQALARLHFTNLHLFRCWSTVGRKYWRVNHAQELSLGPTCNDKATIMHELMHAAGFWHEHSRTDRNQYVEVLWENIAEGTPWKNLTFVGQIPCLAKVSLTCFPLWWDEKRNICQVVFIFMSSTRDLTPSFDKQSWYFLRPNVWTDVDEC